MCTLLEQCQTEYKTVVFSPNLGLFFELLFSAKLWLFFDLRVIEKDLLDEVCHHPKI